MSRARKIGNIVSGVGHAGFIGYVLFGGVFKSAPEPIEFREAAMVSGEEFAALVEAARQPVEEAPEPVPAAPEVIKEAPEVDAAEPEPEPAPPQPPEEPVEEVAEPAEEPVKEVFPQVSEAAPELPEPPAEVNVENAPPAIRPVPRPANLVAPDPAPQPDPQVVQEPEPQEAVVAEETGETVTPPQEEVAPPEAAERIVTEADAPTASAPDASLRPPARRTSQQPETQSAETAVDDTAVQAALEAALSSATNDVPTGPPMSSGEKDALRLAVQGCWSVDAGARWARTTVTVAMNMTQDGKVAASSLRMIASEGGDASTANAAFGAARRAILLCQRDGFPLPPEKYGQWREIEMTFNPERMRIR